MATFVIILNNTKAAKRHKRLNKEIEQLKAKEKQLEQEIASQ